MTESPLLKFLDPNTKLKKLTYILPWGKQTLYHTATVKDTIGPLDMNPDPVVSHSFNSNVCHTVDRKPILPPAAAAHDCITEHLKRYLLKNSMEQTAF